MQHPLHQELHLPHPQDPLQAVAVTARAAMAAMLGPLLVLLLADEPTGNLDSGNADSLFELFIELRDREGQTFVVVTHNDAMAQRGDSRLHLIDGRIAQP